MPNYKTGTMDTYLTWATALQAAFFGPWSGFVVGRRGIELPRH